MNISFNRNNFFERTNVRSDKVRLQGNCCNNCNTGWIGGRCAEGDYEICEQNSQIAYETLELLEKQRQSYFQSVKATILCSAF